MTYDDKLSPEEESAVLVALEVLANGTQVFEDPYLVIWAIAPPPLPLLSRTPQYQPSFDHETVPSRPEWLLGMSVDFRKTVIGMDRKLQGRLMEAITRIVTEPLTPHGDTIKPLTGDARGLWRYRIGDFRLLYHPDPGNHRILLVAFSSRGDAYA